MNLEAEILREHSKRQTRRIALWIGADRSRFRRLMHLFLKGNRVVAQRAAWIVSQSAEMHPELPRPYLAKMLLRTQEQGVHDAVKRNVVRILQTVDLPVALLGRVVTVCFDLLAAEKSPVAVKAYAMMVLERIARREPDLNRELTLVIQQQLPYGTAGFRACAAKVLKAIQKRPQFQKRA